MPFRIFGFLVVHELRFRFYFDLGGFLDVRVGVVFCYRNLFAGQGTVTMQAKPTANFRKREFSVYY